MYNQTRLNGLELKILLISKHFPVHHEESHKGDFKCRVCKVPFTKKAYEWHINRVHPDQGKSSDETKNLYAEHKNRVHPDDSVQRKTSHQTKNAFGAHTNRVHSDDSVQQKSSNHLCEKQFNSNTQLGK